ncbi:MAG: cytochrome P450 [Bacteroidota bacterium]
MNTSMPAVEAVPVVKGWPIIGSTKALLDNPIQLLLESYQEYGHIFKLKTVNQTITMMAGREANLFLAKHANELLSTKETWGSFVQSLNAETVLVALDGEPHAKVRKALARGYSPQMISGRFPKVVKLTEQILLARCQQEIAVVSFVQRLITEQLGLLLVNRAPGEDFEHLSYFIRVTLNVTLLNMWPKIMLKHPRFIAAKKRIHALSDSIIAAHRANPRPEFPDLIDDILETYDEGLIHLSPEDMMVAVVGPFFAGMDTVTNTVSMFLYALKQHPAIYERVKEEVDTVWANGIPNSQLFQKMQITHRFILETLRRYPVTPMIPRTAIKDFVFEGKQLKKGDTVYMAQSVTHFLPELFHDPMTFDIERFAPPRNEHKQKGAFSPYGIGAHKCLGARLGEIQMLLTLATLIRTVEFDIVPKDYQLKMRTLPTIGPEPKFRIRLRKRKV